MPDHILHGNSNPVNENVRTKLRLFNPENDDFEQLSSWTQERTQDIQGNKEYLYSDTKSERLATNEHLHSETQETQEAQETQDTNKVSIIYPDRDAQHPPEREGTDLFSVATKSPAKPVCFKDDFALECWNMSLKMQGPAVMNNYCIESIRYLIRFLFVAHKRSHKDTFFLSIRDIARVMNIDRNRAYRLMVRVINDGVIQEVVKGYKTKDGKKNIASEYRWVGDYLYRS